MKTAHEDALVCPDRFPFHVPTNSGGTAELRAIGPGGFDTNTFRHLLVMSNELSTPVILVCPGDLSRNAATNFQDYGPENVTYRVRSGDEVNDTNPTEVPAVCPVDGNTLFCDGSVTNGIRY
jgi:prepilin-type processing-associated H-X9-DG protein